MKPIYEIKSINAIIIVAWRFFKEAKQGSKNRRIQYILNLEQI